MRDGFQALSQKGCFICKVQFSEVNRGSRGVMFVNQRPTDLLNNMKKKKSDMMLLIIAKI